MTTSNSWFKKYFGANTVPTPAPVPLTTTINSGFTTYKYNAPANAGIAAGGVANVVNQGQFQYHAGMGNMTGAAQVSHVNTNVYSSIGSSTFTINATQPASIITFYNGTQAEIVRLDKDGKVTWANGIEVDEAAEAFARAISLGAEMQAGITKAAKLRMRDSVFEDIISIAKEKGSLTAEDLTFLLEASKIVEKLKGGKE